MSPRLSKQKTKVGQNGNSPLTSWPWRPAKQTSSTEKPKPSQTLPTKTRSSKRALQNWAQSACSANPMSICQRSNLRVAHGHLLWVDGILHHFETMGRHCLLAFTGESSFQGFLGGAKWILSTHSISNNFPSGFCAGRPFLRKVGFKGADGLPAEVGQYPNMASLSRQTCHAT